MEWPPCLLVLDDRDRGTDGMQKVSIGKYGGTTAPICMAGVTALSPASRHARSRALDVRPPRLLHTALSPVVHAARRSFLPPPALPIVAQPWFSPPCCNARIWDHLSQP
ncbi:hypothetical protein FA95DRAFT_1559512 [Auriscalpium vulgare]|uniref:Uncharacterized protein n=1 Tax=Auriscalpium vulgare TaxID=40419 RepID=A0ACB8RSM5_9AGAM|nr:hypothetical protein FA95DRAFT_1559512 [Auriscalpium vulgare]